MELDVARAEALKERGMQLALDLAGDWSERVVEEFTGWCAIQKARGLTWITVEEFRSQANARPLTHFAWGSLPKLAMKAGLIAPLWVAPGVQGRVKAAAVRTHRHEVKQWALL